MKTGTFHPFLHAGFWAQTVLIPSIHIIQKKLQTKINNIHKLYQYVQKKIIIFTNYTNFYEYFL